LSKRGPIRRTLTRWGSRLKRPIWWLPDIPAEQDEAYRRIWQELRSHKHVRDGRHDTADWRERRGVFALCLIRVPASALDEEIEDIRLTLSRFPFVRLHPDYFLHIPIQELGFVTEKPQRRDEMTPGRLQEFIGLARQPVAEFATFPVKLGGVNSFLDAAFLDVHDNGWCSRIHHRLRDFVIVQPDTTYPYLPQVTIAHYTGHAKMGNLPAALSPWRDRTLGQFTASEVEVVTLRLDEAYPPLETVATLPLAPGTGTRIIVPSRPVVE
jgi:2'-5' RNA ligase